MRSVRPKWNAPTASQRNVEGADASAATRGSRNWSRTRRRQGKTPQLPRVASVGFRDGRSPPRAFLGWESRDCTRTAAVASTFFAKSGGAPSAALFYRRCTAFYDAFLARCAAQPNTRRHSAYKHTYLEAQRCFQDCCAQNKSGYSRIRVTDRKKRREAVTNGQGRQGREDL